MQLNLSISPKSVARRLTVGVVVLAILSIAVQIGKYVFNYRARWTDAINLDREMNFPTWYSTLMLVACALLLRAIATGKKEERDVYYGHWQVLSVIFGILAADEIFSLHEILIIPQLAEYFHLGGIFYQVWVIPGAIFVAFFVNFYWRFIVHLPKKTRGHFLLAGIVYVGGALGMEMLGGWYSEFNGKSNLIYALMATLEEILEMLGIVIFIYALLSYLGRWVKELDLKIKILQPLSAKVANNEKIHN